MDEGEKNSEVCALKLYSISDLELAFGIHPKIGENEFEQSREVDEVMRDLIVGKITNDLNGGYTEKTRIGTIGRFVMTTDTAGWEYEVTSFQSSSEEDERGIPRIDEFRIRGVNIIGENRVAIVVYLNPGIPGVSYFVMVNGVYVANRTNPFDHDANWADNWIRKTVPDGSSNVIDRLDESVTKERNPYRLAIYMLNHYQQSEVDKGLTEFHYKNAVKRLQNVEGALVWMGYNGDAGNMV